MVICLERGADLHVAQLMPLPLTVSCFSKIQIGFTFLVQAHPSSHGQRAVKRVRNTGKTQVHRNTICTVEPQHYYHYYYYYCYHHCYYCTQHVCVEPCPMAVNSALPALCQSHSSIAATGQTDRQTDRQTDGQMDAGQFHRACEADCGNDDSSD